jgi:hypothetical protein
MLAVIVQVAYALAPKNSKRTIVKNTEIFFMVSVLSNKKGHAGVISNSYVAFCFVRL